MRRGRAWAPAVAVPAPPAGCGEHRRRPSTCLWAATVTYHLHGTVPLSATGILSNTASVTRRTGTGPESREQHAPPTRTTSCARPTSRSRRRTATRRRRRASRSRYTIVASNAGPPDVTGAQVADAVPAAITDRDVDVRRRGRRHVRGDVGSGSISGRGEPARRGVSVTLHARAAPSARRPPGASANTASVTPPRAGVVDPSSANDSATDMDPRRHARARTTTRRPGRRTCRSARPRPTRSEPRPTTRTGSGIPSAPAGRIAWRWTTGRARPRSATPSSPSTVRTRPPLIGSNDDIDGRARAAALLVARVLHRDRRAKRTWRDVTAGASGTPGGVPRARGGHDPVLPVVLLGQRVRVVHPHQEHDGHGAQRDGEALREPRGRRWAPRTDGHRARERQLQPAGLGPAADGLRPEPGERRRLHRARRAARFADRERHRR